MPKQTYSWKVQCLLKMCVTLSIKMAHNTTGHGKQKTRAYKDMYVHIYIYICCVPKMKTQTIPGDLVLPMRSKIPFLWWLVGGFKTLGDEYVMVPKFFTSVGVKISLVSQSVGRESQNISKQSPSANCYVWCLLRAGRHQLFQVLFILQSTEGFSMEFGRWKLSEMTGATGWSRKSFWLWPGILAFSICWPSHGDCFKIGTAKFIAIWGTNWTIYSIGFWGFLILRRTQK